MLSRSLKWWVVGVLWLSATLAFALPSPKDIEAAVAAGHYTQAETMLREVLHEKPQSAKAHYELGQVLAHAQRYTEAQTALQRAKDIDPSLKFASSPEKFNAVLTQVRQLAATPTSSVVMEPSVVVGTHAATQAAQTPAPSSGISLTYVWVTIAALVVLGLWLRRSASTPANAAAYAPASAPTQTPAPRGFGAQYTPYAPPSAYAPTGVAPAASSGSTMAGAVVGGLAGVAAGYALSKALEGDHATAPAPHATSVANPNGGYVPFDAPSQPDLGAFDAGAGSDWGSADSGGSSDDNW